MHVCLFIFPSFCVNVSPLFYLLYFCFMLSLWCVCVVIAYFGSGRDLADSEERVSQRTRQRALECDTSKYLNLISWPFFFILFCFFFYLIFFISFMSCVYPLLWWLMINIIINNKLNIYSNWLTYVFEENFGATCEKKTLWNKSK